MHSNTNSSDLLTIGMFDTARTECSKLEQYDCWLAQKKQTKRRRKRRRTLKTRNEKGKKPLSTCPQTGSATCQKCTDCGTPSLCIMSYNKVRRKRGSRRLQRFPIWNREEGHHNDSETLWNPEAQLHLPLLHGRSENRDKWKGWSTSTW